MEFQLQTNLQSELPQAIVWNKEEIKAWLSERVSHYNSLVVTEDSVKEAKADRAKLNALKTAIDTRRKEIKKEFLAPLDAFEKDVKEITALIDEPIANIDKQTKAFEQAEKDKKKAELQRFFRDNAKDLGEIITFEQIFNERWLNKTVALLSATQEIIAIFEKINSDLAVISGLGSEYELQIKATYIASLDLAEALREQERLVQAKERLEAAKLAPKPKQAEPAPQPSAKEPESSSPPTNGGEEIKNVRAEFIDTTAAFRAEMRNLCKKHNIEARSI